MDFKLDILFPYIPLVNVHMIEIKMHNDIIKLNFRMNLVLTIKHYFILLLTYILCIIQYNKLFILLLSRSKLKLHRKVSVPLTETPLPSVSILKPLMGVDANLLQNLETFFTMSYPTVNPYTVTSVGSTFHLYYFFYSTNSCSASKKRMTRPYKSSIS